MKQILKRLLPFMIIYLIISILGASYKFISCEDSLDYNFFSIIQMVFHFFIQLLIVFNYGMLFYSIYLVLLPQKYHFKTPDLIITSIICFIYFAITIFSKISEGLFWNEFGVSFNFIAVDYLIYTQEVAGNIWQSYPMGFILSGLTVISSFLTYLNYRFLKRVSKDISNAPDLKERLIVFISMIILGITSFYLYDSSYTSKISDNKYNQEICKNDIYSFFSAFRNNCLNYYDFYLTNNPADNLKILKEQYSEKNTTFISPNNIKRQIKNIKPEKLYNVIVVVMESMDSKYMNENRTDNSNITPYLTKLANEGIYFNNVYSTGTRTVRGLEAITLSLPPQPGMSIIRQKNNDNLFNIGTIFKDKGYSTKFIYGGYGYFDNMNDFYRNNGFEIIDRTDIASEKIHHSTIWGVADEDLFTKVIEENNKEYDKKRPFFEIILTTSNHRPFSFPSGRIDMEPIKSGRLGAVKYSDWAIGNFIQRAMKTDWFANTVFVFVADHGASSAGKRDLNPEKHKIPFIIFAPFIYKPLRIEKTISQIDVMPTLLYLLNFTYESRMMGKNAFDAPDDGKFFISNYQFVGYSEHNKLIVLKPGKEAEFYINGIKQQELDTELLNKAIAYYQYSSNWRELLKESKK